MSQSENLQRFIEEIERTLEQLEIEQQRVEAVTSRLRRREQRRPRRASQRRTRLIPDRDTESVAEHIRDDRAHTHDETALPSSDLCIGDTVRIDNSRDFKQDTEVV